MKRRRIVEILLAISFTTLLLIVIAGGVLLRVQQQHYARNRQLIEALQQGHASQALALVQAGADPNTRLEPSPAPSLKEMLLRFLPGYVAPSNDSPTALLLASGPEWYTESYTVAPLTADEQATLVQAMLLHGADVNATSHYNRTALMVATWSKRPRVVVLLLAQGADVNVQDKYGYTALMQAVDQDDIDTMRLLLEHGANVNMQEELGNSALIRTVMDVPYKHEPNENIIRLLLAHGANPNLPDKHGQTALTMAEKKKRSDLVTVLRNGGK